MLCAHMFLAEFITVRHDVAVLLAYTSDQIELSNVSVFGPPEHWSNQALPVAFWRAMKIYEGNIYWAGQRFGAFYKQCTEKALQNKIISSYKNEYFFAT